MKTGNEETPDAVRITQRGEIIEEFQKDDKGRPEFIRSIDGDIKKLVEAYRGRGVTIIDDRTLETYLGPEKPAFNLLDKLQPTDLPRHVSWASVNSTDHKHRGMRMPGPVEVCAQVNARYYTADAIADNAGIRLPVWEDWRDADSAE